MGAKWLAVDMPGLAQSRLWACKSVAVVDTADGTRTAWPGSIC